MLTRKLFRLARSPLGARTAGWVFAHMSFALPVDRVLETELVVAFHHPSPAYPVHILIVPKRAIASLADLDPTSPDGGAVLGDIFLAARTLVERFGLAEGGYRLILNGGSNQDIPQLHFHLVGEK